MSAYIAAADILLAYAAHVPSDVVPWLSLIYFLMMHLYGLDLTSDIGGLEDDLVILPHDTGLNTAHGHSAYAGDGVYILNRHAQRKLGRLLGHFEAVEGLQEGRPLPPLHVLAGLGKVVAHQSRHGYEGYILHLVPDHLQELAYLLFDLEIFLLVVGWCGGINLVHADDELVDPQCPGQEYVLPGLSLNSVNGRNYQDGSVSLAGSSDHVLDEVSVAGAVHYSKVVLVGVEAPVGNIDGDAPLALLLQAVHNPGVLEGGFSLSSGFLSVLFYDVRIYSARLVHQSSYCC